MRLAIAAAIAGFLLALCASGGGAARLRVECGGGCLVRAWVDQRPQHVFPVVGSPPEFAGYSPRANRLLFIGDIDGGLYVERLSGTGRKVADGGVADAAFSSDGRMVAFRRGDTLWTVGVDGSQAHELGRIGGRDYAWSPDSRRLAYQDQSGRLVVVAAADADVRVLTGRLGPASVPFWSPRGDRLAYVALEPNELHVVDASGSHDLVVVRGRVPALTWSADGRKLAFVSANGLSVIDADGTNLRVVAKGARSPAWARDGRLAYTVGTNVWIERADGSGRSRAFHANGVQLTHVWWSPSGLLAVAPGRPLATTSLWVGRPGRAFHRFRFHIDVHDFKSQILNAWWASDGRSLLYRVVE